MSDGSVQFIGSLIAVAGVGWGGILVVFLNMSEKVIFSAVKYTTLSAAVFSWSV